MTASGCGSKSGSRSLETDSFNATSRNYRRYLRSPIPPNTTLFEMMSFAVTSLRRVHRRGCAGRPAGVTAPGCGSLLRIRQTRPPGKKAPADCALKKSCFGLCQSSGTFLSELPADRELKILPQGEACGRAAATAVRRAACASRKISVSRAQKRRRRPRRWERSRMT